jgi:hypothetical protein
VRHGDEDPVHVPRAMRPAVALCGGRECADVDVVQVVASIHVNRLDARRAVERAPGVSWVIESPMTIAPVSPWISMLVPG